MVSGTVVCVEHPLLSVTLSRMKYVPVSLKVKDGDCNADAPSESNVHDHWISCVVVDEVLVSWNSIEMSSHTLCVVNPAIGLSITLMFLEALAMQLVAVLTVNVTV